MSYLNQAHDPRRRNAAFVATVAIHAAVGYGLVTGLTFTKLIEGINNPEAIFVKDVPLPQPTPTETPKPQEKDITYIPPQPRPRLNLTPDPPPPGETSDTRQTDTSLYPSGGEANNPPAPPPPPRFTPRRAAPANNSAGWITTDDYPRRELIDGREGSVGYRLVIGINGRVAGCELTSPSGIRGLDSATCRLITSRARFEPATDEAGARVPGSFTGSVLWDIPE